MHLHVKPWVRWVLVVQTLLTLLAAGVSGLLGGTSAAISALLGGGIGVLAAAAYAWRALRESTGEPGKLFRAQMLGEGYKFAVTLGAFALVFVFYREVAALPLLLAFMLTFVVYWIALLKQL